MDKLVIAIRDYAQNTLDGECQTGILSALINGVIVKLTVDGDDLTHDPDWRETILAVITGNAGIKEISGLIIDD